MNTNTAYPRPQLQRKQWQSLNGSWRFSFSETDNPADVQWQHTIQVPYPPEASLSGIGDTSYHPVVWYQRTFTLPETWTGQQIHLNFGAVDYHANIWINGHKVLSHEGGHTPFSTDISHYLTQGEQTITVRAEDDPLDINKPRGKQDWQPQPHSIWYPRTSGIWQTVWLEPKNATHIQKLRFTTDITTLSIQTDLHLNQTSDNLSVSARFHINNTTLAQDNWQLNNTKTSRSIHLPMPGLDDTKHLFWTPEHPNLINVTLELRQGDRVIDTVESYTALRKVEVRKGQFLLNDRPYFLRLALDQGYWDDGLLAAPDDAALKKDVELAKQMGFNGVRKHQKIEDPRYLYWADTLGLLVWEEMPSAYDYSPEMMQRLTREWLEVIERDYNHPCIVAWVCFNESWGVPALPHDARQRNAVKALYALTKALDATRPVIGNDGWEHVETDLLTIHDYSHDGVTLEKRYASPEASRHTSTQTLEHGRAITLECFCDEGQPVILSEFGGIRFSDAHDGWGYQQVGSADALLAKYAELITAISHDGLAGFCYTQFADTFLEQNGLLYSDRRPKVDLQALAKATRGGGGR